MALQAPNEDISYAIVTVSGTTHDSRKGGNCTK